MKYRRNFIQICKNFLFLFTGEHPMFGNIMKENQNTSSISFGIFFYKISILLTLFFIIRVLFFLCNYDFFSEESKCDIIRAFLIGVRVDVSTIVIFNLLFFILWSLPVKWKTQKWVVIFSNYGFFIVNFLALLVNIIDAKYFSFTFRRMGGEIFGQWVMLQENTKIYWDMLKHFWYVVLVGFFVIYILGYATFKLNVTRTVYKIYRREYVYFLIFVAIFIIGVRGGLQGKPFKPVDINICAPTLKTAYLANNSALNIFHTRKKANLPRFKYYELDSENLKIYSPIHKNVAKKCSDFSGKNIFVIILESFSAEYIGALDRQYKAQFSKTFTPFLDTLIKKSYIFDAFANSRVSIDSLTAIVTGIPPLFDSSYITSAYVDNKIESLLSLLSQKGYQTLFFYGGKHNSCNFDSLRTKAKIRYYFCQDDYDGPSSDVSCWGVYDDRFLQFAVKKVQDIEPPFISILFTLSSHHPFSYPEDLHGQFPTDSIPLPEVIAYTDYSLRKFFESAEKTDWYKNTIFVLVADHTSCPQQRYYQNSVGGYSIPLIIFDPSEKLVGKSDIVIQQIDIMPTILNLVGYDKPYFAFGNDAFDQNVPHFSVSYSNGIYQIITCDFILQFNGQKTVGFYLKSDFLLEHNLVQFPEYQEDMQKIEALLKSFLQQYSTAICTNAMTYDEQ